MTTATRAWLIASLLGVACSGEGTVPGGDGPIGTDGLVGSAASGTETTAATSASTLPSTSTSNSAASSSTSPTGEIPIEHPPSQGPCVKGVPKTTQVPRLLNRQYDGALRDLLGITLLDSNSKAPSASLGPDDPGALIDVGWTAYQNVAAEVAHSVVTGPNRAKFINCDPAATGCLETTVKTFGRQAFRRQLTDVEVTSFMRLDNLVPKGEPDQVAEAILYSLLTSPSFIMLPELAQDTDADTGAFKLAPNEVATRLALLLWGSVPDNTLLSAAENNQLSNGEQILAQAQRMVALEAKTGPLLADYHRFYADVRNGAHWDTLDHDTALFPAFNRAAVSPAMMAELDKFFQEVAFSGGFKDLFLSKVAYVNQATAPIYGLDASLYGSDLTRVELSATDRPGFLTRLAFLSSYSRHGATSPILRGAFISQKVIGARLGPPKIGAASDPMGTFTTNREAMEVLTSPDDCSYCHKTVINPPGFVMESYDAIGGIQTRDPMGGDINTTADVALDGATQTIHNALELMTAISNSHDAQRHYVEQWVTYSTGRSPNDNDGCTVQQISSKLSSDGYTIVKLLADLSQAESFTLRNVEN